MTDFVCVVQQVVQKHGLFETEEVSLRREEVLGRLNEVRREGWEDDRRP